MAEGGAFHPVSLGSCWALLFCSIFNDSDRRCRRGKCEEKDPRLIPPDEDSDPCSLALWFLFTINAGGNSYTRRDQLLKADDRKRVCVTC